MVKDAMELSVQPCQYLMSSVSIPVSLPFVERWNGNLMLVLALRNREYSDDWASGRFLRAFVYTRLQYCVVMWHSRLVGVVQMECLINYWSNHWLPHHRHILVILILSASCSHNFTSIPCPIGHTNCSCLAAAQGSDGGWRRPVCYFRDRNQWCTW